MAKQKKKRGRKKKRSCIDITDPCFSLKKNPTQKIKIVEKKASKKHVSSRPKKLRGYARQKFKKERKKWKKRAYKAAEDCIEYNIKCGFSEKPGLATIKQIRDIEYKLWKFFY